MTERIRYWRPLGEQINVWTPEIPKPTAVFNGPLVEVDGQLFIFPREQIKEQRPGMPDIVSYIGVYQINPKTLESVHKASIPVEVLQGNEHNGLFTGAKFPEDLRAIVLPNGDVFFGLTAVGLDGVPFPAILTARFPFNPRDFSQMRILYELSVMKNVMPLNGKTIAGRTEVARGVKQKIVFAQKDPEGSQWQIVGETIFPDVPWVGEHGRFGLVSWNERIPVPGKPDVYRLLIHGYKEDSAKNVEYALGLSEIQELPNGTFCFRGVDKKPLLSYDETTRQVFWGTGKMVRDPDPKKKVIYSVGGTRRKKEIILPVTICDHEIHFFTIPVEMMLREFSI